MRRLIKRSNAHIAVVAALAAAVAALVAASPAGAAGPTSGTFTVRAGQTVTFSAMNINSSDGVTVYYCTLANLPGGADCTSFVDNSGSVGSNLQPADVSVANPAGGSAQTYRLGLYDTTRGVIYMTDHVAFNYNSGSTAGWQGFDHAIAGKIKGKLTMSVNDGALSPFLSSVPSLGGGTFNVTISIGRTQA